MRSWYARVLPYAQEHTAAHKRSLWTSLGSASTNLAIRWLGNCLTERNQALFGFADRLTRTSSSTPIAPAYVELSFPRDVFPYLDLALTRRWDEPSITHFLKSLVESFFIFVYHPRVFKQTA